jgi:hypoxanthine-DNA glycosylase
MLKGFPPIADENTHTLILGSFPGVASLDAAQYYAHPRNQFWRLVGTVIGEPLNELPYDERVLRLLKHGIGLWDVLAACEREGQPQRFRLIPPACAAAEKALLQR